MGTWMGALCQEIQSTVRPDEVCTKWVRTLLSHIIIICVVSLSFCLPLSLSLSLFWQLKLGFWTFLDLIIHSIWISEPVRVCFTSSIWVKHFTGQWFTFCLYDADTRLAVGKYHMFSCHILEELRWLKLNIPVTVNRCQQHTQMFWGDAAIQMTWWNNGLAEADRTRVWHVFKVWMLRITFLGQSRKQTGGSRHYSFYMVGVTPCNPPIKCYSPAKSLTSVWKMPDFLSFTDLCWFEPCSHLCNGKHHPLLPFAWTSSLWAGFQRIARLVSTSRWKFIACTNLFAD